MNQTVYEKGIEKGIEKGRRETLLEMLEDRFTPLPAAVAERLQTMSLAELASLRKAILRAQSLSDLGLD